MDSIYDKLENAVAATAEKEAAQLRARFDRLRQALDEYEKTSAETIQRHTIEKMFTAISMAPPPTTLATDEVHEANSSELRAAVQDVWSLLSDSPLAPTLPIREEASPNEIEQATTGATSEEIDAALQSAVDTAEKEAFVDANDLRAAEELLAEVKAYAAKDISLEPIGRVYAMLQVLAAEGRGLLTKLPKDHRLYSDILDSFRIILDLKERRGVGSYIEGLSRGSRGNWERIATIARRKVEAIDNGAPPPPSRAPKKKPELPPVENPKGLRHPRLAKLSEAAEVMIVGGRLIPERLEQVRGEGLTCEWYEIQKKNPRTAQSVAQRIMNRSASAVIILENFMSHSTFEMLKTACNQTRTPFVMADKGGKGSLDLGLTALEHRLQN